MMHAWRQLNLAAKITLIIAPLSLLFAAAFSYYWPVYQAQRDLKWIEEGREALQKGDFRTALFQAATVLQHNPRHPEAVELIAQVHDVQQDPDSLRWRFQASKLRPNSTNLLLLASSSLRHEGPPFRIGVEALLQLKALSATPGAEYHIFAGQFAQRTNDLQGAISEFQQAVAKSPENLTLRYKVGLLQLLSPNTNQMVQGQTILESLQNHPVLGERALRWLTRAASMRGDSEMALKYSSLLEEGSDEVNWPDKITHMEVLYQVDPDLGNRYLSALQKEVLSEPSVTAILMEWMKLHGMAEKVLKWHEAIPSEIASMFPIPAALSANLAALGDWEGMIQTLSDETWSEVDWLRQIWLSVAFSEIHQQEQADQNWLQVLAALQANPEILSRVLLFCRHYDLNDWRFEALEWGFERGCLSPRQLEELTALHFAKKNTPGLYRCYLARLDSNPDAPNLMNNVAHLGLLLRKNMGDSIRLAAQAYELWPDRVEVVMTFAYAMRMQGKSSEALEMLQLFGEGKPTTPHQSLYWGLLYKDLGQVDMARKLLQEGLRANLLTEESDLASEALRQLNDKAQLN